MQETHGCNFGMKLRYFIVNNFDYEWNKWNKLLHENIIRERKQLTYSKWAKSSIVNEVIRGNFKSFLQKDFTGIKRIRKIRNIESIKKNKKNKKHKNNKKNKKNKNHKKYKKLSK